jgi:hypothetical protein
MLIFVQYKTAYVELGQWGIRKEPRQTGKKENGDKRETQENVMCIKHLSLFLNKRQSFHKSANFWETAGFSGNRTIY